MTTETRPTLTVIIVTYACRDLVADCLESLSRQGDEPTMQVIVVDNQSPDGTLEAVGQRFPWVDAMSAGGNVGFSVANNRGLTHAAGEYVLLLNPDTIVPPGALAACLEELRSRPEVGMLGCKLVMPDGTLDHACKRGSPTPASALWYFSGVARLKPRSARFAAYTAGHVDADETDYVDAINGAFMLVRREALVDVGALDEDYWMYGEDLDWCRRFWTAGWKVLYWPGAEVVHVKGGSSTKVRAWRVNKAFHRAMWQFYAKHEAPRRATAVNACVWTGIHLKLALSAVRSAALRWRRDA